MTADETNQAAAEITTRMKAMTNGERTVVLEAMRQLFCTRCGDDGPESKCWCDYDSPIDYGV